MPLDGCLPSSQQMAMQMSFAPMSVSVYDIRCSACVQTEDDGKRDTYSVG